MCWHDTEVSAVWAVTQRRARKAWRCYECDTTIDPGQPYDHIASLYDGRWDTYRVCAPCAAAHKALTDACRLYDISTYPVPLGDLHNALTEHLSDERWRLGDAPEGLTRTALRDLNRHHARLNGRKVPA